MNPRILGYLPMLILSAGALLVFICGALVPSRDRLFRAIALVASGVACLAAFTLAPDASQTLIDAGPQARFFTVLISGLTFICLLFAGEYARRRGFERDEFHALVLLSALGMVLFAVSTDWIMSSIGLETLSLPLYVLIASRRDDSLSLEAAVKYFVMGAVASAMFFFGAALLYAVSGTLDIGRSLALAGMQGMALLGLGFILVGLAFKLSLAPLHLWTPDVYQGAPAPVAAFLSGGAKVAVFAALVRIAMTGAPAWRAMEPALWAFAALSMTAGTLGALTQNRVKRMMAYSSVAHMGYLVLALLAVFYAGAGPAMFAAAAFGVMDVAVFGSLGLLSPTGQDADLLDSLRGMGLARPGMAAVLAVSLLTLGGLPPTVGFMSKVVVFKAALSAGYLWLSAIGIFWAIVGVFYILRVLMAMYVPNGTGKREPDAVADLEAEVRPDLESGQVPSQYSGQGAGSLLLAPGFTGWLALALSALLMIGLGVLPMPVLDAAAWVVKALP
jgi:NADH-quinone oxidoreductase subunit N